MCRSHKISKPYHHYPARAAVTQPIRRPGRPTAESNAVIGEKPFAVESRNTAAEPGIPDPEIDEDDAQSRTQENAGRTATDGSNRLD